MSSIIKGDCSPLRISYHYFEITVNPISSTSRLVFDSVLSLHTLVPCGARCGHTYFLAKTDLKYPNSKVDNKHHVRTSLLKLLPLKFFQYEIFHDRCSIEFLPYVISRLSDVVVPILLTMQEVPSSNLTTSATHLPV